MNNDDFSILSIFTNIVGKKNMLVGDKETLFYRKGIRIGEGVAIAVLFPETLMQFWNLLNICVEEDKIIIIQAANTGLTGGSTPYGEDYERDVVIINTLKIDKLILIKQGLQAVAFPGTTLYQLEDKLSAIGRSPHSVIGSSCIGASVIGGICNNSGGNLVKRGPAYTELALYAKLNKDGKLELVNELDIELGASPEEIILNLQNVNFDSTNVYETHKKASDIEYQKRVKDVNANTPARFNADKRRLYNASGCAGKLAVFAVRLDTFPKPEKEQVFFVGTNDPNNFTALRKKLLTSIDNIPDMGEYMHRSYFDGSDKYCKDNFLLIKYLGTSFLPVLLLLKRKLNNLFDSIPLIPNNFTDIILQFIANLFPDHLSKRVRQYRDRFEHYVLILASDDSIEEVNSLLEQETMNKNNYEYFICNQVEGKDLCLHRYVAGSAPSKYAIINADRSGDILPLDISLPRNNTNWDKIIPDEILNQIEYSFKMGHFLCMVFHWDFVVKKGIDAEKVKQQILEILDQNGAKYPAEHNVGHLYEASQDLKDFYKNLDPTNTFNAGIGKTSKKRFYQT